MNTLEAIRTKRSTRLYSSQPVTEESIRAILEAGRYSQSSKNDQPWTFILIQDKDRLRAVSECGTYAEHIAGAAFAIVLVDHNNWSFDIGQAAAYLQLAAWDMEIGSCLAYFQKADELKELLNLPKDTIAEIGISFGYSAEAPRKSKTSRKPLDEVVKKEHW